MFGAFRNSILCEDIREEIGNKKSLLGVFSGSITVPQFPVRFRVSFYTEYIRTEPSIAHELQFVILIGSEPAAKGTINVPEGQETAVLLIPQGIVEFEKEGELALQFGYGTELVELVRKKVILA